MVIIPVAGTSCILPGRLLMNISGQFPDTYNDIIKLKGIGPYTAAAISSFAFGLPYAVVDGNVLRVLSRVFGIQDPIDGKKGKDTLNSIAEELLDKKSSRTL